MTVNQRRNPTWVRFPPDDLMKKIKFIDVSTKTRVEIELIFRELAAHRALFAVDPELALALEPSYEN